MKLNRGKISLIHRVICFLLAAYLFNFSIDSRDAHPDTVAEDLSINDIESVYEFLAENLLGFENAVEEHDERDQDEGGSFEFKKFFFLVKVAFIEIRPANFIHSLRVPFDFNERLAVRFSEINAPPPRA
jgi:hypothetical protein